MIIAVDFDGTIVEHAHPLIGTPIPQAIECLKQLQKDGHILLLWTCREGESLQEAIEYCERNRLHFFAVNKNSPDEDTATAIRKLNADLFIDDKNLDGLPEWTVIYKKIQKMQPDNDLFVEIDNERS